MPVRTRQQRQEILDRAVASHMREGWLVQNQSETRAQMIKPATKKSCLLIVVLLLLGILPGILYLLWPSRDKILIIEVDESGRVHRTYR